MQGDHTFFIAMSYGATLVALIVEIIALRVRRARALKGIEDERELETQE
jgi:heme exporter protein CcmD